MTPPAVSDASAPASASLAALIREQSAAEVVQIVADAEERAQRSRAAAEVEAQSVRAQAERLGTERGRRRAAELLAIAEAESRMELLRGREVLIDAAMEQARTQLASFTTLPKAADILATFIREALRVLQPGPLRVCLPEGDGALLDAAIRKSLGAGRWALRFETDAIPGGGVIVETEDGRLRFDNSLDARMRRHRNDLRQLAADALFAETEIPEAHGAAGDR